MEIKIIPIREWTGKKNDNPRPSQFRAIYSDTLKLLKFELEKAMCYGDAQIQMFINPGDMRLDGNMRASAKPYQPGVKLVFRRLGERFFDERERKWKYKLKTVSYPCDAFDNWQDNLRAIALSMEALRRVERYGVFKYGDIMDRLALPSADREVSTREQAAEFIARFSDYEAEKILIDSQIREKAYRQAATVLHPDSPKFNGNPENFIRLQESRKILEN